VPVKSAEKALHWLLAVFCLESHGAADRHLILKIELITMALGGVVQPVAYGPDKVEYQRDALKFLMGEVAEVLEISRFLELVFGPGNP
jgi:hypothetical protein